MGLRNYKDEIIFIILLFVQNIAIFWQQYFNNVGFPWDFNGTDYAWPAFSTTAISMGIFPQWIPYQSMGYPLALNAQSAFYYPIFWIFAILHIPYTLHYAAVVEVLHVLFGTIGMFLLLNSIFKSSRYALIGSVAFQFFGGFYAHAEQTDVLRSFALAPWVFYVFKLNTEDPKVTRPLLFIPLVIYLIATGAYPGNFISTLFIIPVFLLLQIIDSSLKHIGRNRPLRIGGVMSGLLILGISLSVIDLGPIWQGHDELTRFHNYYTDIENRIHSPLQFTDFPGVAIPNQLVPNTDYYIDELSMFITLPLLIFASFISVSEVKNYWVFIAVPVLSILMVFGPQSPFWQAITSVIPALALSRFPSTDYLVFIAIPIVILGIAGLTRITQITLSWKEFLARAAFIVSWFSLIIFSIYSNIGFSAHASTQGSHESENFVVTASALVLAATLIFIRYLSSSIVSIARHRIARLKFFIFFNKFTLNLTSSTKRSNILSRSALVIIAILILVDGLAVILSDTQTWKEMPLGKAYIDFNVPLKKNGKLITYTIFENIPNERPARTYFLSDPVKDIFHHNFSWMGYLNGSYMMQDYTNAILVARSIVESNNVYRQYMLMKWTPILLEPNVTKLSGSTRITLPVGTFSNAIKHIEYLSPLCSTFVCDSAFSSKHLIQPSLQSTYDQLVQTRYGINDIGYRVILSAPKLMIENEIYFPGWQADLIFPGKVIKLNAFEVNGVFRAWLLPSGEYRMIAHFGFPNLLVYQSISVASFGIWIFIVLRYWGRLGQIKKREFVTTR